MMRTIDRYFLLVAALVSFGLLLILTVSSVAAAADAVGRVTAATGEITAAVDVSEVRSLKQGDPVFSGDTISTGPNARVRIVFSDSSILILRPSSRMVIAEFLHNGDVREDRSTMSLIRGGFRAVTGGIGQANPEASLVETPVATIGIRGTDHQARFCAGDCIDLMNLGVDPPPDGLYTGTNTGRTFVAPPPPPAPAGQLTPGPTIQELIFVGPGEFSFTPPSGVTVMLPQPPPILTVDPDLQLGPEAETSQGASESPQSGESTDDDSAEDSVNEQRGTDDAPADSSSSDSPPAVESGAGDGDMDAGDDPGFDIPARPPTVRAIQCS